MALLQQALNSPAFTESGFGINQQQVHRRGANRPKLRLRLVRPNFGVLDQASRVCLAAALRMSCELSFHLLSENLIPRY